MITIPSQARKRVWWTVEPRRSRAAGSTPSTRCRGGQPTERGARHPVATSSADALDPDQVSLIEKEDGLLLVSGAHSRTSMARPTNPPYVTAPARNRGERPLRWSTICRIRARAPRVICRPSARRELDTSKPMRLPAGRAVVGRPTCICGGCGEIENIVERLEGRLQGLAPESGGARALALPEEPGALHQLAAAATSSSSSVCVRATLSTIGAAEAAPAR